jgi:hypothetical protein
LNKEGFRDRLLKRIENICVDKCQGNVADKYDRKDVERAVDAWFANVASQRIASDVFD